MAKFGIDSNMVFDANGKSVATRLSDHDTQMADIAKKMIYYHISNFGAKGDGTTDDTTAIQNALNYSNSNHVTILFDNKKYRITSTLTLPSFVSLSGGTLTGRTDNSYNGTVFIFDMTTGNAMTSNNNNVSGYMQGIVLKIGNDGFWNLHQNVNLFNNTSFNNMEFRKINFLGAGNVFYNCSLGVVTTLTQCSCYNPYTAFFNTCSLVDIQIYENYFSGGKIPYATGYDYPSFYLNCTNHSLVQVNDNWFEFFKQIMPNCYGESSQFNNNLIDFSYGNYANVNNYNVTGNTFSHCSITSIKNNFSSAGITSAQLGQPLSSQPINIITVTGFPFQFTNNIWGNSDVSDGASYLLYVTGVKNASNQYPISNCFIKNNVTKNNRYFIKYPSDYLPDTSFPSLYQNNDIDNSISYTQLPTPNSTPQGFTFYLNQNKCITAQTGLYKTVQAYTKNFEPIGYLSRNLLPSLNTWSFTGVTKTVINNFDVQITDPTGGWKMWTYDITVNAGEWYRINYEIVNTVVELYIYDSSNNQITTLFDRKMDFFSIPTNGVKLTVALRSNLTANGTGEFKNVVLNKYNSNGTMYGRLIPINNDTNYMLQGCNSDGTIFTEMYGKLTY
jgi:hypothetical protein